MIVTTVKVMTVSLCSRVALASIMLASFCFRSSNVLMSPWTLLASPIMLSISRLISDGVTAWLLFCFVWICFHISSTWSCSWAKVLKMFSSSRISLISSKRPVSWEMSWYGFSSSSAGCSKWSLSRLRGELEGLSWLTPLPRRRGFDMEPVSRAVVWDINCWLNCAFFDAESSFVDFVNSKRWFFRADAHWEIHVRFLNNFSLLSSKDVRKILKSDVSSSRFVISSAFIAENLLYHSPCPEWPVGMHREVQFSHHQNHISQYLAH